MRGHYVLEKVTLLAFLSSDSNRYPTKKNIVIKHRIAINSFLKHLTISICVSVNP